MRKQIILGLLFMGLAIQSITVQARCLTSCECEATSRSYLSVRPLFDSVSPELFSGFRVFRPGLKDGGCDGAVQIALFGSKSVHPEDLARYFFPFCKTFLVADEILNIDQLPRDLWATNFNVFTQNGETGGIEGGGLENQGYRGIITIAPRQSVIGFGMHYRQAFWRNEATGCGLWASVSSSIQHIKNDMHFCEQVIDDGGGVTTNPAITSVLTPVANMTQAFTQPAWNFGKISMVPLKRTGLADIELKIGYEWLQQDPCHLESYGGILIPTGNVPDGEFLFQPIVGWGHHPGVMFGNAGGISLWEDCDQETWLRMEWAAHTQYLFKKQHIRSFDLKDKPWSRYLTVYASQAQAQQALLTASVFLETPGINVFTQKVNVTPGFMFNMITAFILNWRCYEFEGGYNFFARRPECVDLACPWQETVALKHRDGLGITNPVRDITGNIILETPNPADFPFLTLPFYQTNVIRESDLDLLSASTPSLITHTMYGSVTYNTEICNYPAFSNFGGSYEFSNSNNAVVSRWVLWGKAGISF